MKYLYVVVAYTATALLTGLGYWFVRSYITMQEPPQQHIIVSNLTLNYVLFYAFVGGTTYWVANKKLFRSMSSTKRSVFSAVTTLAVAILFLVILSPWYQLRI